MEKINPDTCLTAYRKLILVDNQGYRLHKFNKVQTKEIAIQMNHSLQSEL